MIIIYVLVWYDLDCLRVFLGMARRRENMHELVVWYGMTCHVTA